MKRLELMPYNDKSFIVVGSETRNLSKQLKALGGRFCFLPATDPTHAGYYMPAWVYSLNKYNDVCERLESIMSTKNEPAKKVDTAKAPAKATAKAPTKKEPTQKQPAKKEPVRIKPIEF